MTIPSQGSTGWCRLSGRRIHCLVVLAGGLLSLAAYAAPQRPDEPALPNRQAVIGKARQDVIGCAGAPIRETPQGDSLTLTYYKEAPMLQESFYTSNSDAGIMFGRLRSTGQPCADALRSSICTSMIFVIPLPHGYSGSGSTMRSARRCSVIRCQA